MNSHSDEETLLPPELVPLVEDVSDRFEASLKDRGSPLLEHFLTNTPEPVRAAVFRELLGLELDYRIQRGENPAREDYLGRFPQYNDLIEAVLPGSAAGTGIWIPAGRSLQAVTPQEGKLPEFLSRYRVIERLGSGGQGEVFRAVHPVLGKDVVIKWARRNVPETVRQQLIDEARILARLDDPGVVRVYDADLHEGRPFIVMEYLPARTLAEMLQHQEMPREQAVALVADLAAILARLHQQGVYHRDLKPANVLVDATGKPRLIDFGLACLAQAWQQIAPPEDGVVCGTFAYMPPEQARGQGSVGGHTDVFGLGALLYQLLTHRPPYQGRDRQETLRQARQGQVTPPRQFDAGIPPALERLCLRALAPDPAVRPSAGEFERELRALLPRPRLVRRRWLAGVAGVGLLALLGGVLGLALRSTRNDEPAPLQGSLDRGSAGAEAPVPFKGYIDLVMSRPGDLIRQRVRLNDPASRPLRMGDKVHLVVKLNRPAYLYVLWIDVQREVQPVYPWLEGDWKQRRPEEPKSELRLEKKNGEGFEVVAGPPGLETMLLLVRETPLPEGEDLGRLLAGLSAQKRGSEAFFVAVADLWANGVPARATTPWMLVRHSTRLETLLGIFDAEEIQQVAWFENGRLVTDESTRSARLDPRGIKVNDAGVAVNPVLWFQQEVSERLGQRFVYTRAVTFGNLGGK